MKNIFRLQFVFSLTPILPLSVGFGWLMLPKLTVALPSPPIVTASTAEVTRTEALSYGLQIAQTESAPQVAQTNLCPDSALSRLARHTIAPGETLESIAQRYNLIPATLQGFNPALRSGNAPAGTEILIPPYNGVQVNAPAGTTWRQLAQSYGVRADALFEVNGCQETVPSVVFVPGVNWSPAASVGPSPSAPAPANNPLSGYPLPAIAEVLTSYGWQLNPSTNEFIFESGVNLQAEVGTPVLAVGTGTVAFAGADDRYGNLVVVNHSEGLQTRYAQLGDITVQAGQQITAGTSLGTVGAYAAPAFLHFEVRSNSNLGWVAQDPGSYIPDIRSADQIRRRPQTGNSP
jgi:murein DD-endopeptidase MepM/ murein hydrolase activator NlpD